MELISSVATDPAELLANSTPALVIDTPSPYPLPRGDGPETVRTGFADSERERREHRKGLTSAGRDHRGRTRANFTHRRRRGEECGRSPSGEAREERRRPPHGTDHDTQPLPPPDDRTSRAGGPAPPRWSRRGKPSRAKGRRIPPSAWIRTRLPPAPRRSGGATGLPRLRQRTRPPGPSSRQRTPRQPRAAPPPPRPPQQAAPAATAPPPPPPPPPPAAARTAGNAPPPPPPPPPPKTIPPSPPPPAPPPPPPPPNLARRPAPNSANLSSVPEHLLPCPRSTPPARGGESEKHGSVQAAGI